MTEKETGDGRDSIGGIGMDAKKKERDAWKPDITHVANEWADTAINGLQWIRNIVDGISDPKTALSNMEECIAQCRQVSKDARTALWRKPNCAMLAASPQPPADTIAVPMEEYEAMKLDAERYRSATKEWTTKQMDLLIMHLREDTNFDADLVEAMLKFAIDAAKSTGEDV